MNTANVSTSRLVFGLGAAAIILLGSMAFASSWVRADTATSTPMLSTILVTPSQNGATVTWNTDQDTSGQVLYGTSASYNASTTLNSSLTTSHVSFIGGLLPNTMYHYQIVSGNASGTMATSTDATFMTLASSTTATSTATSTPGVAPIISSVIATTTGTTATVTWITDTLTTTQVEYGLTNSYGSLSTLDNMGVLNHSAMLSGLTPNTQYHFRVWSVDASSTVATSSDMYFLTKAATTTPSAASTTLQIMVMKHLCNPSIKTMQDFVNLGNGKGPVATLAADVLACPTTGLVGNAAVAGSVASPRSTYDFSASNVNSIKTVSGNGVYMPHQACESDLNLDVDGNGTIASTTCLDISHYELSLMGTTSPVTVTETMFPSGYHPGALRFTPTELDGNNDASSLTSFDASTGVIKLDPTMDKDGMIMLHVYNFADASTTTPPTTGTSTLDMLQAQIDALKLRISALETWITNWGGWGHGTTTPPTGGGGSGTIDQNNSSVNAGGNLDLSGRGFGHEETVTLSLNGATVKTAHADGGGNFSTGGFAAPSTPGSYVYHLVGQTSGIMGTANITVH